MSSDWFEISSSDVFRFGEFTKGVNIEPLPA